MGAPFGNKNAKGNAGGKKGRSGRKSAAQERTKYAEIKRLWTEGRSMKALLERIRRRKYNFEDVMMYKALGGDQRLLIALFNKVYPASVARGYADTSAVARGVEMRYDDNVDPP